MGEKDALGLGKIESERRTVSHSFSRSFSIKLARNEDLPETLNELELRPDRTWNYGVSCPWAS